MASGLFFTRRRRSKVCCYYSFATAVFLTSRSEYIFCFRPHLSFQQRQPISAGIRISDRNHHSKQIDYTNTWNIISSRISSFPKIYTSTIMSSSSPPAAGFLSSCISNELSDVGLNYRDVLKRVEQAALSYHHDNHQVRLVAVSKTKPIKLLMDAYDSGCRSFGENYVQEMIDKVPNMPNDVQWHFIGALQSNKCNALIKSMNGSIDRLTVETMSSVKLANKMNNAVMEQNTIHNNNMRLKVFVQVNTSAEDSKSGVDPGNETIELCQYIIETCPMLELCGLMTIGAINDTSCFQTLVNCKNEVIGSISDLSNTNFELSMGMSGDFEEAIAAGATNVRVGSTIFGERDYSNKK
jgi:PLP dependent protein